MAMNDGYAGGVSPYRFSDPIIARRLDNRKSGGLNAHAPSARRSERGYGPSVPQDYPVAKSRLPSLRLASLWCRCGAPN